MLSTRKFRTTFSQRAHAHTGYHPITHHTHACARALPPPSFRDRSLTVCSIPIRYPTHGELYTICASSFVPDIVSDGTYLLRLERHRYRELFHPGLPVPPSRTARRYVGRRGAMGLRPGSCGSIPSVRFISFPLLPFSLLLRFRGVGLTLASSLYVALYFSGIDDESSFELTLLKRAPSCEVWGYDYSVNSVRPTGPSTC